jgi:hypothetical protein
MGFDNVDRELYWQLQKNELRKMHQQERDELWQMQAQRHEHEAKARMARLRAGLITGSSPMSRLVLAIIWWYAMPPMPIIRKLHAFRLLRRLLNDGPLEQVEAKSRADALSRLGLPPDWNGTRAELNRHTKPLAEQAWRQQEQRALKLWELCWAQRLLLDPVLAKAIQGMQGEADLEPPKRTTAPKVVDTFQLDGTDYVTIGLTVPELVLAEWARYEERATLADKDEEILAPMSPYEAVDMIAPALMQDLRGYLAGLLPGVEWPKHKET